MAPRQQHTFTLVPNPLGMQGLMSRPPANAPQSKPPMTSKQAQKLYREANRAPRVSKAEQRRLDREEQDRIRRELDKEKQANKARILREKKKVKEQQVLDEKRRKGLPLVAVHPSQDTIARFVRGNGAGKKRDAEGVKVAMQPVEEKAEDSRSTTKDEVIAPEKTASPREVKRRRLSQRGSQKEKDCDHGAESAVNAVEDVAARNGNMAAQEPKTGSNPLPSDPSSNPGKTVDGSAVRESRIAPPGSEASKSPAVSAGREVKIVRDVSTLDKNTRDRENPSRGDGSSQMARSTTRASLQPARLPENIVQDKPIQAKKDEALARGTPPNATNTRQQHGIPIQRTREQGTTPVVAPKLPGGGHDRRPTPNKTPANTRPAQTPAPCPPPPKSKAIPPPQQQRPSPNVPPTQQPPPRKPLQETTNLLNRDQPPSVMGGASKFASPYRPPLPAPRRQPSVPAPTPSFRQTRPETLAGKAQKPHFLRPPHRPAPLHQHPDSARRQQTSSTSSGFISAPPTSTQLFIMAHLDDLCPSPSQEARELQGDEPPAVIKPPRPVAMPAPLIPRPASKPTGSTSRFMLQTPKISAPMAPPPRPKPVKPATATAAATVKPALIVDMPFCSTQDLLFSSQDLRDIDEPTTTPCKMGSRAHGNPPPFKPRQGPSPLGRSSKPAEQPTPRFCPKQPPASEKSLPRTDAPPQHEAQKPRAFLRQATPVSPCPETSQPSQPTPCPGPGVGQKKADTARGDPPRPPSPEKLRFFGSSGGGIDLLRAVCESRKSHQEEERKRQAEQAARQPNQSEHETRHRHQTRNTADQTRSSGPTARDADVCKQQSGPPTADNKAKPTSQVKAEPAGDRPVDNAHAAASQETDYGDVELDSIDFDELGLGVVQTPAPKPELNAAVGLDGGIQGRKPEAYSFDDLDYCMLDDDDDGPWI
ncbi:hypothetical protein C8A05DRAFT_19795 [Staphylotrichum tortipilum]|uniref:Uncharacterized protein n=1 Tax=Staphylotrichum tortipilum TaxID=2831512 RepID=A0AAN6MBQ3_9PEZI|nr:hypothetical protein C8A05DRAFT_19795 [Staphylotrichum longicolle]